MTTNIELDSFSGSLNEHSASNEHSGQTSPAEMQVAQANSTQQAAPAASEPVPVDVGGGAPVKPEAPAEAKAPPAAAPHEYVADASHVVRLPANVSIDNIKVDGHNLVLEQADGSVIVIKDGALNVPTFIIGDVEVPRVALLAALEASHVDVAFGADGSISAGPGGSNSSAGGDFSVPPGGIGDGFDLSALLPPTALQFGLLDRRELFPSIVDRQVSVVATSLLSPDQAASETGLDGGPAQSPGSDAPSHSETSGIGTINITAPDGIGSIIINGVAVTAVGQEIPGQFGFLTIVSYNPSTGAIEYNYTVTESVTHPEHTDGFDPNDTVPDNFSITVTDVDGDSASTTFAVAIVDDVPTAVADSATQATENTPVTVNVFANDVPGADGVNITDPTKVSYVAGSLAGGTGTVTYHNDGTFTYAPVAGEEGTVTFQYQIIDGDGDSSVATVTINLLKDSTPTIDVTPQSPDASGHSAVDEAGLAVRGIEPAGSGEIADNNGTNNSDPSETATGSLNITTGSDTIGHLYVTDKDNTQIEVTNAAGGILVHGQYGDLTITGTPGTGYTYSYTLLDNTSGNTTHDDFAVQVVDTDGDPASTTLTINIVDDVPTAHDDSATQATENAAVTVNVFANDVPGADGVAITDPTKVSYVANSLNGGAGTVTYHNDGTFTYAPVAGEEGTVTFQYQIVDGDGDPSVATVTINLLKDSTPTIDVTPDGGTPSVNATAVVDEKGLPAGTGEVADPALNSDQSETTAGTFNITTGGDTLQKLEVMDKNGTLVDVTSGGTVQGVNGVLTVTVSGGVYSYSYTLSNNVANADPNQTGAADQATGENFAVKVTDSDNDTANASLTVTVDDDIPVAVNDGQAATEGGAAIVATAATGVLANDHVGADQPGTVTAVTGGTLGNPIVTAYGTLTLNGDGSYIYTPKASVPAGTVDSFTYTMKDADGDTSQAVLSFTFSGDNNHATAGVSATLVDEDNLATGNNDNALGDDAPSAQPGTLTHNYGADGAGHIALVSGSETVNGTTYTYTANGAGTQIIASAGGVNVFQVDLTNAVTGTYTVTLLSPVQHPTAGTEDNLGFNLSYKVYDADDTAATAATGTLTVTVDDDIPVAKVVAATPVLDDDAQALFAGNPGGTGDVADAKVLSGSAGSLFTAGADGLKALSFAGPNVMAIYKTPSGLAAQEGVQYTTATNAGHTILTATGVISGSIVFVLDVAPDGSYAFTLSEPLVHPTVGTTEETMNVTIGFTVTDGDSDTANGSLMVQVNDDTPTFTHITNGIVANQDNNVVVGTHDLAFGADGEQSIEIMPLTNISGLTYLPVVHNADGSSDLIAQAGGSNFFDLKVSADGTYTFTLIESRPVANQTFDFSGVSGGASTIQFTLGDATFKAVDTNGNGSIGNAEELKPTSNGFGVQNGNLDVGEQFQINFATAIDKLNFFVEHEAAGAFTMTYTTNTGLTGTATTSVDGLLTIDPTGDFTSITFTVTEGKAKFDNFGYSKLILPSDQTFNFSVSGVDGDGDHSANQTLSITTLGEHPAGTPISGTAGDEAMAGTSGNDIINGLAGNDTLFGGSGADQLNGGANDDLLIGGFGQDTLTGGTGADTFKLDHLELNIKDLIIDYNKGEGDQIDLTALFDKAAGTIADYVHYDTGTKTLSVDTDGSGNAASFVDVAVLQNGPATSGTINILYDDTAHTQHTATI
ncbi:MULTISPECIES: beta strand repeat-containing protein [Mesorhizobium]|uniref:beta strand repeat-containing protein n=1 Tax=Mesorhizobium TaxID=68287 RepID=UPI0010A9785B|nr:MULTISPECIES: Ig-like domain-containing protein [Mesorhizobium]